MFNLSNLRKESRNGWTYLCCDFDVTGILNPFEERTMWVAVEDANNDMLSEKVYDPFVLVPVMLGMYYGQDVHVEGKISARLYHNLKHYLMRIFDNFSDFTQMINFTVDGFDTVEDCETTLIGTGFSCGVDSFSTVYDNYVKEENPNFRVNSLFLFNSGTHGAYNEESRQLWMDRAELNRQAADELGLPLYLVDSNLHAFTWKIGEKKIGYLAIYSCVLSLQKYLRRYLMASDFSYDESVEFSKQSRDYVIAEYCESYMTHLIATERLEMVIDGCQYTRAEKLERISDWEIAQKYLNVCVRPINHGKNCSCCAKCMRTLLVLDAMGKLDNFEKVFDMKLYKRVANYVRRRFVLREGLDGMATGVVRYMREHDVELPRPYCKKWVKKKTLVVMGSGVAHDLTEQSVLRSVFEIKNKYLNYLPWNAYQKLEISSDVWEQMEKALSGDLLDYWNSLRGTVELKAEYVLIDLCSLVEEMVQVSFQSDRESSMLISYPQLLQTQQKIKKLEILQDEVQNYQKLGKEFINKSLEKFAFFLKTNYQQEQIIVIRPRYAKKFVGEKLGVHKFTVEEQFLEKETALLTFTDYFIEKLEGCKVVEVPESVTATSGPLHDTSRIHYIQSDYLGIADILLKELDINYKEYWDSELEPADLEYERWIQRSGDFYRLAVLAQAELMGESAVEEWSKISEPMRLNATWKTLGLYDHRELQLRRKIKVNGQRSLVYFGAGKNCSWLMENVNLECQKIIDNDREKAGQQIAGIEIVWSGDITDWSQYFVAVTCTDTEAIEEQLCSLGLKKDTDYALVKEYYNW